MPAQFSRADVLRNIRHYNPLTAITQLREYASTQPRGVTCRLFLSLETGLPFCSNARRRASLKKAAVILTCTSKGRDAGDPAAPNSRLAHPRGAFIGHPEIPGLFRPVGELVAGEIARLASQGWIRFNPTASDFVPRGFLDEDIATVLKILASIETSLATP